VHVWECNRFDSDTSLSFVKPHFSGRQSDALNDFLRAEPLRLSIGGFKSGLRVRAAEKQSLAQREVPRGGPTSAVLCRAAVRAFAFRRVLQGMAPTSRGHLVLSGGHRTILIAEIPYAIVVGNHPLVLAFDDCPNIGWKIFRQRLLVGRLCMILAALALF
jgi:hypothetical protein